MKHTGKPVFPDSLLLTVSSVIITILFLTGCQGVLNINSPPKGTINSPSKDVIVVTGASLNFQGNGSDSDSGKPLSYKWDFNGGAPDSTAKDPGKITFKTPGTYKVTLTVTDADGLSDPEPPTIEVKVVHLFVVDDSVSGNELWMTDGTAAGTKLVKDINLFGGSIIYKYSNLTNANGMVFFVADDGVNGYELWKSDGTEEGTILVKDINHGAGSAFDSTSFDGGKKVKPFTSVNGIIFFFAYDGVNGYGLWKSDGTEAGTVLVRDINPSYYEYYDIINYQGTIFFAEDNGIDGCEIWKIDGTEAGTIMVKDINQGPEDSNPYDFTEVDGALFFIAYNNTNGFALWKTDGTEEGTVMVKSLKQYKNPYPFNLTDINGTLFFVVVNDANGRELWKSDGTENGTVMVKVINSGPSNSSPSDLLNVNGVLFFISDDGINGRELWKSDGTETGTIMVKDITVGKESSDLSGLTEVNGTLFFNVNETSYIKEGLWKSDGTEEGTVKIKDFNLSSDFSKVNDTLYFLADGGELWKSDGTEAGTVMVTNINAWAKSSTPGYLTKINNNLIFQASDGTESGSGLWSSDGTEAGTAMIKKVAVAGYNPNFVQVNDTCFFVGIDENGAELWKTDGTEAGTLMVKDIHQGPFGSKPSDLINVNGTLYFTAYDEINGEELWKSDGTESGTAMVKNINQFSTTFPYQLTNINGTLYFINGDGFWKSDGTEAGTVMDQKDSSLYKHLERFKESESINGNIYFIDYDKENGVALWQCDGTSQGTALIKVLLPSPNNFFNFYLNSQIININGTLFFIVNGVADGIELWKSDGTAAGTIKIKDIEDSGTAFFYSYSEQTGIVNIEGTIYFSANDGNSGVELWKSDGTEEGTKIVKDINAGSGDAFHCFSNYPGPVCLTKLTSVNGKVFFWANDGTHGFELWKSDGTEAGTVMVKDTYPGSGSSFFSGFGGAVFISIGDSIYFTANDGTHGFELWKTDGTEAGTVMVSDINTNNQ